jgi:hypothetical protein
VRRKLVVALLVAAVLLAVCAAGLKWGPPLVGPDTSPAGGPP